VRSSECGVRNGDVFLAENIRNYLYASVFIRNDSVGDGLDEYNNGSPAVHGGTSAVGPLAERA
jgi:hypothetical protein